MRLRATTAAVIALSCTACDGTGKSPFFESRSPVRVIDTVPLDGETGVSIDAVLEIEFSGEIKGEQALEDAFTLVELPSEAPVAVDVSYAGRIARVTLAGSERLDLDLTYRARLAGLLDARGRPIDADLATPEIEPFEWTFTTIDPPAAALAAQRPAQGSLVPGNFVVRAVFSVPLDPALLGANPIRLNGGAIGGSTTYDAAARALVFRPTAAADGAISVTLDPVFDVYGRQFQPSGWTFDAAVATEDALRPTLPGAVTAAETSAGTITITFDPASDDQWSGDDLRYEAILTRLKPPSPAGCLDPFDPEARRAAVFGSAATLSVSGLPGGTWSVLLEAEDGSGRRSVPKPAAGTVSLTEGAPTFEEVIQPLLLERCAFGGCHAGTNPPGFVDYTDDRETIVGHTSQAELPLVTPFCLERSYLWRKITVGYEIEGQLMPPDTVSTSSLSRRERELFRAWIVDQGGN